jgi:small conductance mechanosensitive channel
MEAFTHVFEGWMLSAMSHAWVLRIVASLAIAFVGMWAARWLSRLLDRLMREFAVEEIMRNFLRNLAYAIALVIVFIAALDFAGVPTTSLLAVLGAAGLAIGLALKDSLSNIASGVMLIVLRPFHTGDSVQIAGLEGVVESVRIFQTRMHTADNRLIILPNSQITAAPIINYTVLGERRVDLTVPIAFGEDFPALRTSLLAIASANARVHPAPKAEVVVLSLGEGTVSVQLRAWVAAREFSAAQAELLEAILADYARRGAKAPLPKREVHVFHHDAPEGVHALDESLKPNL